MLTCARFDDVEYFQTAICSTLPDRIVPVNVIAVKPACKPFYCKDCGRQVRVPRASSVRRGAASTATLTTTTPSLTPAAISTAASTNTTPGRWGVAVRKWWRQRHFVCAQRNVRWHGGRQKLYPQRQRKPKLCVGMGRMRRWPPVRQRESSLGLVLQRTQGEWWLGSAHVVIGVRGTLALQCCAEQQDLHSGGRQGRCRLYLPRGSINSASVGGGA